MEKICHQIPKFKYYWLFSAEGLLHLTSNNAIMEYKKKLSNWRAVFCNFWMYYIYISILRNQFSCLAAEILIPNVIRRELLVYACHRGLTAMCLKAGRGQKPLKWLEMLEKMYFFKNLCSLWATSAKLKSLPSRKVKMNCRADLLFK